jgi:cytoskeletal protein CcmA (bactofilin family)
MSILSNANELDDCVRAAANPHGAAVAGPSSADAFDPSGYFERWLQDLSGQTPPVPEIPETADAADSQFYLGSFPGSNCEVAFEGVLHFDGYSIGNINSPQGTLVLTQRGRIEADIEVAVAVINGTVTGNISASERVVLDSNARVTGLIRTRALSVRLGAVLDGDCIFIDVAENFWADDPPSRQYPERLERFAVGVGA